MKRRPLVALSSAAVFAVYGAGYMRTRAAADRFAAEAVPRRAPASTPPPLVQAPPAPPRVQPGEPVIAPPFSPRVEARPRVAPAAAAAPSESPLIPQPVAEPGPAPALPTVVGEQVAPTPPPPPPPLEAEYKDGTYLGWGYCRHGDIQASIVIEQGRIKSAAIARCLTRYSCSWIDSLLPQVSERQTADVDWVSGASESSDAFHQAVADALAKAQCSPR